MSSEDTVEPQNAAQAIESIEPQEVVEDVQEQESSQVAEKDTQTQVPLSALQKERKKRQELELELQWERQRQAQMHAQQPPQEDNSRYESATREDLSKAQHEIVRIVEEKSWIKNNPEKYEKLNEFLPEFLKQRPNLASAINAATNRYEEAYTLMEALTHKQQQQIKIAPKKKEAPNSPGGIPKAAALNQVVDVMTMSDSEFSSWRSAQKKRR